MQMPRGAVAMRDAMGLTWLRRHHWVILLGLAYAIIYMGSSTCAVSPLAREPSGGLPSASASRTSAAPTRIILVFSTLFLGPLALVIGLLALIFVLAVFGGFLLPVVRWCRMPDWIATATVHGGCRRRGVDRERAWLPRSIWFLGLLARACRIVINVA